MPSSIPLIQPDELAACCSPVTNGVVSHGAAETLMKLLVDAGLVTREQRGTWAYYRLVPNALSALSTALEPAVG